jgi:hypothetical protein
MNLNECEEMNDERVIETAEKLYRYCRDQRGLNDWLVIFVIVRLARQIMDETESPVPVSMTLIDLIEQAAGGDPREIVRSIQDKAWGNFRRVMEVREAIESARERNRESGE